MKPKNIAVLKHDSIPGGEGSSALPTAFVRGLPLAGNLAGSRRGTGGIVIDKNRRR